MIPGGRSDFCLADASPTAMVSIFKAELVKDVVVSVLLNVREEEIATITKSTTNKDSGHESFTLIYTY